MYHRQDECFGCLARRRILRLLLSPIPRIRGSGAALLQRALDFGDDELRSAVAADEGWRAPQGEQRLQGGQGRPARQRNADSHSQPLAA